MKRILLLVIVIAFIGCKKDNSDAPTSNYIYLNTKPASTWTYHEVNNSTGTTQISDYTITSSSNDSSINGRNYHVYHYSYGGSQYLSKTNNNYYEYDPIPGGFGEAVERWYLTDNTSKGASWTQDFSIVVPGFPLGKVPVKVSNTIAEKDIERTVSGITYKNVIHVKTTISSSLIPESGITSEIDSYFAPDYGLIENSTVVDVDYMGIVQKVNIKTTLSSADLK